MFLVCMKSHFSSLKFIFGVLGIMFLALLIGGSLLFSGTNRSINTMTENIKITTDQSDLTVSRIGEAI